MRCAYTALFQSTPDLVNRENLFVVRLFSGCGQFQSTPDLVNRENVGRMARGNDKRLFQSTPDLVNRENGVAQTGQVALAISIHSRFS